MAGRSGRCSADRPRTAVSAPNPVKAWTCSRRRLGSRHWRCRFRELDERLSGSVPLPEGRPEFRGRLASAGLLLRRVCCPSGRPPQAWLLAQSGHLPAAGSLARVATCPRPACLLSPVTCHGWFACLSGRRFAFSVRPAGLLLSPIAGPRPVRLAPSGHLPTAGFACSVRRLPGGHAPRAAKVVGLARHREVTRSQRLIFFSAARRQAVPVH